MRHLARHTTFFCLTLCALPLQTSAEVRINEIAWMGTTESHLCNWVELYNSGEQAIDIIDWSIQINDTVREFADGEGPSSVIVAEGYLLLKRQTASCPDPVPDVPGWSITMGNLPNGGATLRLLQPDGTITDEVVGGTDWSNVGGDNETKFTAQRTDTGWITAEPTPGAQNMNIEDTASTATVSSSNSTQTRVVSARAPRPQSLTLPDSELAVDIVGPAYGYVNQPLTLTASTSGVGNTIAASLRYNWNWGDMHNQHGGAVAEYTYRFPGTYVVTLFATYGRHEQVARAEVTILPTPLAIEAENGLVHIHNIAPYEVDVSGVSVSAATEQTFPPRSFIPAHGTVTLTGSELGLTAGLPVVAHSRRGELLASTADQRQSASIPSESLVPISEDSVPQTLDGQSSAGHRSESELFRFSNNEADTIATDSLSESPSVPQAATSAPISAVAAGTQSPDSPGHTWWSSLALLALLFIAAFTLLLPRRQTIK